jgi:predicted PurR-regulated permease PerM
MIYALRAILGELSPAYENMASLVAKIRSTGISPILSTLPDWLEAPLAPLLADRQKVADFLTTLVQSAAGFLQSISAGVIQWTGAAIFQSFIALTTMFFLIRDGERVVDYVKDFVPLGEERERFIERTGAMLNSVAYGVILTVAIQAALGGIAWWIAGLPSAFLASAAMFLFGMFPMGASVIWGPGAIYLIAIGETVKGAALLAWGALVVSTIDNVLRPLFIGGGAPIPTLAIILGISGGIAAWGLLGVFLGPLAIATFLCVLDMYRVKR